MRRVTALACAAAVAGGCGGGEDGPKVAPRADARWRSIVATMPAATDPASDNVCGSGGRRCIDEVVREMRRRLRPLAAACDHNAAFALMYLRVTDGVAAGASRRFRDPRYLNHLDAVFAELYFKAFDAWRAGRRDETPEAWRIAFDAADKRRVTGLGDMLLGMNAHISRDLPYALETAGLTTPSGRSGEPDFDRVNRLLADVQDPMIREASRRFDPSIGASTLPFAGVASPSVAQLMTQWRTEAWRNAERLLAARGPAKAEVRATIEEGAAGRARLIESLSSNLVTGPDAPARERYCGARRR